MTCHHHLTAIGFADHISSSEEARFGSGHEPTGRRARFVTPLPGAAVSGATGFVSRSDRWKAIRRRDPAADNHFFYAVLSTSIYCYPSCASRPAKPENVVFYATREQAELAGFRPCKRCRPNLPPPLQREAFIIASACRRIEQADGMVSLTDLAAGAASSPHHFHRLFRRMTGVTPRGYADICRQRRLRAILSSGERVTRALYEAGFNSSGRFYDMADAMLGMTPTVFRSGGIGEIVHHVSGWSSHGNIVIGLASRGACGILIGEDRERLLSDLSAILPNATFRAASPAVERVVKDVIREADSERHLGMAALPPDIRRTAFQRRTWEGLLDVMTLAGPK